MGVESDYEYTAWLHYQKQMEHELYIMEQRCGDCIQSCEPPKPQEYIWCMYLEEYVKPEDTGNDCWEE